jgi:hypothetical protein
MLLLLQQNLGFAWGEVAQVVVPDVVGETQAAGTATLEGDGFVVAVTTAYSSLVAAGLIISQVPTGGASAASGSTVTITVSLGVEPVTESTQQPAGKARKPKRFFVQIDGRDFPVASPQEAVSLLQQASALAERAAERQVEQAVKAAPQALKVKPVAAKAPQIRTNAPIDLEPYRRAIEQAYRNAAAAAEIRLLLDAQLREDDEMAAYLLLH